MDNTLYAGIMITMATSIGLLLSHIVAVQSVGEPYILPFYHYGLIADSCRTCQVTADCLK